MREILNELWQQYTERARTLLEHLPSTTPLTDPVDRSILWQIERDAVFAPCAPENATLATLQLPELCSGESTAPLVFVTINPSYGGREIFPTVEHLQQHGAEILTQWFEHRFAPNVGDVPLRHGRRYVRRRYLPTCWDLVVGAGGQLIRPRNQLAWGRLDWATQLCFDALTPAQQQAPLGRAARLFDIVPWKFAMWRKVNPQLKRGFLTAGAPWLRRGLEAHKPAVIIACGEDVRRKMREMDGAETQVPEYQVGAPQCGWFHINTPEGQRSVRWFGVAHPSAPPVKDGLARRYVDVFRRDIQVIAPLVRAALRSA